MKRRQQGMLVLSLLGATVLAVMLAGGAMGQASPAQMPMPGGDWERVDYPALDRLIRQRADEARARAARERDSVGNAAHEAPGL